MNQPIIGQTYTVIVAGKNFRRTPTKIITEGGVDWVIYSMLKGTVSRCTLEQWAAWVGRAV